MIELMLDDDSKDAEDMRSAAIKATIALISMVKSPYAVIFEEFKKLSVVKAPPVEVKSVPQETANKVAQAQSHVMRVATAISSIAKLTDADESELSFQIAMLVELAKVENGRADEKLSEAEALLHSRDESGGKVAS
ncbi:hypothetical protein [Parasphingorhabdus sp.]|uniref:hypothetical protein n=1 Tax=Parasphingorhabdus sp. TaxID=2709688 RepID=UPI003A936318